MNSNFEKGRISLKTAADLIRRKDNILILSHRNPDGDTLGSAFALCYSLLKLGKKVRVDCSDGFPERYGFLYEGYKPPAPFEPEFVIAVDTADTVLLGQKFAVFADKTDLCIDHHLSNTFYAENTLLEDCAAAAEIIYALIQELQIPIDALTAACVYTGISTDTGCFKFSNTSPNSHVIAAEMMKLGAPVRIINYLMFEKKSKGRFAVERTVYSTVEFFFDGRCSLVHIPLELIASAGTNSYEIEGIAAVPRQIEGVEIAFTLFERSDGSYRVSVRSSDDFDSSGIAKAFGGGGHFAAAGCTVAGNFEEVRSRLLAETGKLFAK
ncbi:MAG: DHH family phosphoesterase [Oscillospiraceae bacterium]|jgi:phosphoesterase RecJ-like protein|nr:DHH family phosphoesterase [Oscillospiraceae bacterium]